MSRSQFYLGFGYFSWLFFCYMEVALYTAIDFCQGPPHNCPNYVIFCNGHYLLIGTGLPHKRYVARQNPLDRSTTGMYTVAHEYLQSFDVLCFLVVMISDLCGFVLCIYPYSSGLLHWYLGNHMFVSAIERTQKDMGKKFMSPIHNKLQQHVNCVHNLWGLMHKRKLTIALPIELCFCRYWPI